IFDLGGARGISRHDFFGGSVYSTKNDEGAGKSRLQPELYLFHLAELQAGAERLLYRTHADGNARVFPRQSLAQHPRYFTAAFAEWRASRLHHPRRAGGHALERVRDLQRIRALRKRRVARPGRVSRFGKVSV